MVEGYIVVIPSNFSDKYEYIIFIKFNIRPLFRNLDTYQLVFVSLEQNTRIVIGTDLQDLHYITTSRLPNKQNQLNHRSCVNIFHDNA